MRVTTLVALFRAELSLENIYHRPLSLFDLCSLAHGAGDCSCEVVADVFDVVIRVCWCSFEVILNLPLPSCCYSPSG